MCLFSTLQRTLSEHLFKKIVLTTSSILRLLDSRDHRNGLPMLLDIPSIASMTRNLVEAYDVFWYLTVDKISEDESEFRFALSSLHHNVEFLKITENLKLEIDDPTGIWEIARPHSKRWLEGTALFKALHPKQQAELLKGKRPFFLGNRTPAKWKYINQDAMRGLYKFMSNNTHTHPVSINLMIPLKL